MRRRSTRAACSAMASHHGVERPTATGRGGDDAVFVQRGAGELELGLDHEQEFWPSAGGGLEKLADEQAQGDEGDIGDDEVDDQARRRRPESAEVQSLAHVHAGVLAQARARAGRGRRRRPRLRPAPAVEEHLGEAAGGGSGVEGGQAGQIAERVRSKASRAPRSLCALRATQGSGSVTVSSSVSATSWAALVTVRPLTPTRPAAISRAAREREPRMFRVRRVPGRVCSQGAHLRVEGVEQGAEVIVPFGGPGRPSASARLGPPVLDGHFAAHRGGCRGRCLAHFSSSVGDGAVRASVIVRGRFPSASIGLGVGGRRSRWSSQARRSSGFDLGGSHRGPRRSMRGSRPRRLGRTNVGRRSGAARQGIVDVVDPGEDERGVEAGCTPAFDVRVEPVADHERVVRAEAVSGEFHHVRGGFADDDRFGVGQPGDELDERSVARDSA
jgi:hypothetical protein